MFFVRSFATSSQSCYTTYGLPVSKNGPVKQAITSIERSYLFLVGGILLSQAHVSDIRL